MNHKKIHEIEVLRYIAFNFAPSMKQKDLEKQLSPFKLMIPIVIGMGVIGYLFFKEFDPKSLSEIQWGKNSVYGLFGILLLVGLRFLGYVLRIRILSDQALSWRRSFEVIVLWSFASAISPSAVGGTALAVFILNKEGISIGKSTTIAITTLLLDLLFFVFISLLVYFILGSNTFFGASNECGDQLGIKALFGGYKTFFFTVLGGILLYLSIIFYTVFINPNTVKAIIMFVFRLPFLKKFKKGALKGVDDLKASAKMLKTKKMGYWVGLFLATSLAWTARFLLVNPVLSSLVPLEFMDHLTLYARNFVLWMVMIIPTTPGASGVSEVALSGLICEFVPSPSISPILILVWRFFDYFIYLILGMIILPKWIARTFKKKKKSEDLETN